MFEPTIFNLRAGYDTIGRFAASCARLETAQMFTGRIYFDFVEPAVWRFYRFLTAAARDGVDLQLEWRAFLADPEDRAGFTALCAYEAVRKQHPERHGSYLQALLGLHHLDGADLAKERTLVTAAASAEVPAEVLRGWATYEDDVRDSTDEGRALGVTGVPCIYRHGPVMLIDVNPASYDGDVTRRLRLIDQVLEDDGVWGLNKP